MKTPNQAYSALIYRYTWLILPENASLQSRDRNYAISIYQSRPIKSGGPSSRLDLALSTVLLELVRLQTSSRNKKQIFTFFLNVSSFLLSMLPSARARFLTADLHPKNTIAVELLVVPPQAASRLSCLLSSTIRPNGACTREWDSERSHRRRESFPSRWRRRRRLLGCAFGGHKTVQQQPQQKSNTSVCVHKTISSLDRRTAPTTMQGESNRVYWL